MNKIKWVTIKYMDESEVQHMANRCTGVAKLRFKNEIRARQRNSKQLREKLDREDAMHDRLHG